MNSPLMVFVGVSNAERRALIKYSTNGVPIQQRDLPPMVGEGFFMDGGDGGNRTRVRKIRPSELYERSLPKLVTAEISIGQ